MKRIYKTKKAISLVMYFLKKKFRQTLDVRVTQINVLVEKDIFLKKGEEGVNHTLQVAYGTLLAHLFLCF